MKEEGILQLCVQCFSVRPAVIRRCAEGIGNYVYYVKCSGTEYIFRCSAEPGAYSGTVYWLEKLNEVHVPVPEVIGHGTFEAYDYLILSYIPGKDIGLVYPQLTDSDKRTIAKEIVRIQNRAALLELEDIGADWSWSSFVQEMLNRASERISRNGYFDAAKVEKLRSQAAQLEGYFAAVRPKAYLDDISSKNLLILDGHISGIIDVDWMGMGDPLTYVALTNMALLNLEYDTDYVGYILEEMGIEESQKRAFLFYTLMYCVDFMGERGMCFMDKRVEVNEQVIDRLNRIFDMLQKAWKSME